MKLLGLTGGSGTGKSAACAAFRQLGCGVIDADAVYHTLCDSCVPMLDEIQSVFGNVISTDRKLDRKALGQIVFADEAKLRQLNEITHPYIRRAVRDGLADCEKQGKLLCILDAPVLFEAGLDTLCDKTCAVLAAREIRIARITARDGVPADYAALRVDAQKDDAFYREHCDCILQNNGDLDALHTQVRRIFETLVDAG